jgi:hypothetical protein
MKPSHLRRFAAVLAIAPLLAGPVAAQNRDASLLDALSLLSGGLLVPRDHPPQVTRDGDLYRVRVPLPALTTPPDAAITALARPLNGGIWDITALTLPSTGSVATPRQGSMDPGVLTFSIGQQAFQGRIDPRLAVPSPFKGELSKVTLRTEAADQHTDQTIERAGMEGTFSGDANGHMNVRSLGSMANWLITGAGDEPDSAFKLSMKSATVRTEVDGLDRARAERLRAAAQAFSDEQQKTSMGTRENPGLSPTARARLGTMIDALDGLLTRLNVDKTIQGVHFDTAGTNAVDVGKIQFGLTSDARDGRVAAAFDINVSDPVVSMVPRAYAALMPRRIGIKPAISGMRTDALIRLLRDASAEDFDAADFQTRAIALLNEPGARAGIETLLIESGPLRVDGSARVRPLPDGAMGFDVHLAARGLDAMVETIQRTPEAMQILPMVFLAKGMAKPQGDTLVWDISVASGAVTVNGVPLGEDQPGPKRAPARR